MKSDKRLLLLIVALSALSLACLCLPTSVLELLVTVHNLDPDFMTRSGLVYLDLTVEDSAHGDQWAWRFPGHINPVLTDGSETFTVDPFYIHPTSIEQVTVCVIFDDPEVNPTNTRPKRSPFRPVIPGRNARVS